MLQKKDKGKILFFRESSFKVAELIFNYPNKIFHIRLLEKETGFSTTAVTQAVKDLHSFKIVKIEKTPLTTNIMADLDSEAYRFYKQVFNLYRLKRYLIVDFLINSFNNPETIVLFGSFAKGEDIEGSDIDLLIITKQKEVNVSYFEDTCEKVLNRKANLHILPSLEKSSKEFKNAVSNGIVLHGYLKVL